jgi:hypothetical protein
MIRGYMIGGYLDLKLMKILNALIYLNSMGKLIEYIPFPKDISKIINMHKIGLNPKPF